MVSSVVEKNKRKEKKGVLERLREQGISLSPIPNSTPEEEEEDEAEEVKKKKTKTRTY